MFRYFLILGLTTTFFIKPAFSRPSSIEVKPSKTCLQAISFVLEDAKSHGVETPALYRYTSDANQGYYGNPTDRNGYMTIVLAGNDKSILDIMNSTTLMTNWANRIVSSCLDVATVSFGKWQSGWSEDFVIQENGTVKQRSCFDSDIGFELDKIPWDSRQGCAI